MTRWCDQDSVFCLWPSIRNLFSSTSYTALEQWFSNWNGIRSSGKLDKTQCATHHRVSDSWFESGAWIFAFLTYSQVLLLLLVTTLWESLQDSWVRVGHKFCFCLPEKWFHLSFFLKDNLDGYINLGWQDFFLLALENINPYSLILLGSLTSIWLLFLCG